MGLQGGRVMPDRAEEELSNPYMWSHMRRQRIRLNKLLKKEVSNELSKRIATYCHKFSIVDRRELKVTIPNQYRNVLEDVFSGYEDMLVGSEDITFSVMTDSISAGHEHQHTDKYLELVPELRLDKIGLLGKVEYESLKRFDFISDTQFFKWRL